MEDKDYNERIADLHRQGATYLRLSARGLCMWTEWQLPDGTIVHVNLENTKEEQDETIH